MRAGREWSWADIRRAKGMAEKRALRRLAARGASGFSSSNAAVKAEAPRLPAKIDLSRAPSAMELQAESWKGRR